MGRWTPLILMAGGLAILLGTLLGINFPMGGQQSANAPTDKKARVLPANINVNSTAGSRNDDASQTNESRGSVASDRDESRTSVAQNNATDETDTTDTQFTDTQSTDGNQSNEPIRALW
ncbi:hypothetical protein FNW02_12525 [Komarekiella sp. 'clone 1']|uniref:Uncharacterized protein n=1 Tax=Komarekiella delphini-convector SJRDD-AB1 TaxID=2593771 RepID=A0AA40VQX0_9NOST|nr:hypothetical protein [Komarekiella delphini-convector]MBD6616634.1 hypothetical protein [Komarekiella delphini-convector SJRDD-AB1]